MGTKDKVVRTTRLQYSEVSGDFTSSYQSKEPFLKGPIPLSWIQKAAVLPGKAINVALSIRWLSDMNPGSAIKISSKAMKAFGFSNDACSDALKRLESIGMIDVKRLPGQKPIITLKDIQTSD